MWEEYELTPHNALLLRNEEYQDLPELKKQIYGIKDDIRNWVMSMSMPLKNIKKSVNVIRFKDAA